MSHPALTPPPPCVVEKKLIDFDHVTVDFGKHLWILIMNDHVTVHFGKTVLIDLGNVPDWFSKSVGRS